MVKGGDNKNGESVKDKTIVVWFSCGAASAVAAKLAIMSVEYSAICIDLTL